MITKPKALNTGRIIYYSIACNGEILTANFTYVPKFDRIHKFLEERLGTSDVSMRFFDLDLDYTVRLWSNEPRRGFIKAETGFYRDWSEKEIGNRMASSLVEMSAEGPMYFNLEDVDPYWLHVLRSSRGVGFAFSERFSKSITHHNPVNFNSGHGYDALLCHEGAHAAVDRSKVLDSEHVKSCKFKMGVDEGVATEVSLEYIKKFEPSQEPLFTNHMQEWISIGKREEHYDAYCMMFDKNPVLAEYETKIREANKKIKAKK